MWRCLYAGTEFTAGFMAVKAIKIALKLALLLIL
jgi:hypothetical protein